MLGSDRVRVPFGTRSTSVPLRWVVGLAVVLVSAGATLFSSYTWLDGRFDGLDRRLDDIERRTEDPWTRSDMRAWVGELKAGNRESVSVPLVGRASREN